MKQCEFCDASMADDAGFCGTCGRLPSRISHYATHISDIPTLHTGEADDPDDKRTVLSVSGKHIALRTPSGVLRPITLIPLDDKSAEEKAEDEERRRAALFGMGLPLDDESDNGEVEDEERRRAALFGMGLSLLEDVADHPTLGQVPVIPNTPQIAQVPVIPNTPQIHGAGAFGPGAPTTVGNPPLPPHIQPPQPLLSPPPMQPIKLPKKSTGQSPHHFAGCLPLGAIFLATILVILLTTIGLSLTTFAPALALNGSSTVTAGSNLILHGHNFLPDSSVTLTLDGGISLPSAQNQLIQHFHSALPDTALTLYTPFMPAAHNTISTLGDGTFTATILISSAWTPGHHTIYANEAVSHRNASLPFTIAQANSTTTPGLTPTDIPTATATATPSPTPTATPTTTPTSPPTLSCATPGHLSLGPISEFSSQLVSARVTLCTAGSGTLTWKASWKSPWLQIKQNSGSIQAPNQVQTTISASAAKLAAGTYTASVTFVGKESNTSQTITVTLTVKAGCVDATPQRLSFSGVEGISDPGSAQNISITNCGLASTWSATIDNGSNWLNLSSSKGTLQDGDTKTIAVTASNLDAKLQAGTYQDTITFTLGSATTTVKVSLVVQAAPPIITANPASLNAASSPCTSNENGSSNCTITLTNQSSTTALTWSASADGNGVNVQADSTTIPNGGSEQVTIIVPTSNCGTQITINFKAPGNSASITWNCTPQTPIK